MRAFHLAVFFLLNINYVLCRYVQFEDRGELVFTSILFRHGERNPDGFYPNDPYKNLSFWPEGLGMLTDKGKLHHFQLGQWLRNRYSSLIPDGIYSHDLIYVRSTDVDRTLMSALADLSGMFYPTTSEEWGDIEWQPIPVHTIPQVLDKTLAMKFPCPKINQEEQAVKDSEYLKLFNDVHKDVYKYIEANTGQQNIQDPQEVGFVWTNLQIEYLQLITPLLFRDKILRPSPKKKGSLKNFTLPEWAKSVYPDILEEIGGIGFGLPTHTPTLKRLRGGPLLKDMITNMKQKKEGTLKPNRKLWIYSGHDTTIAALLDTMGVFQPHMPPFAATVMVELRRNKNQDFFVEVYYKKTTEPTLLSIPGCTPSCPLEMFEELLAAVIPGDWDAECQSNALNYVW